MDVITRTTFHLQARNRKTDDQAETGPDRVGTDSGSGPTSETCAHRFDEFQWIPPFDEFHLHRVSNQGLGDNCSHTPSQAIGLYHKHRAGAPSCSGSNVIAVYRLIPNDQPNHVCCISELRS